MADPVNTEMKVDDGQSIMAMVESGEAELDSIVEGARREAEERLREAKAKAAAVIEETRRAIDEERRGKGVKIREEATLEAARIRREGENLAAEIASSMNGRVPEAVALALGRVLGTVEQGGGGG